MEKLTRVRFSNLDKVLYPELGLTKADIIQYYIRVAPRMLPFLRDRALVRDPQHLRDVLLAINSNRAMANSKSIISLTNPIRER